MGEPSKEEYKIQCFDAETQQLLKTALKGEQHAYDGPGEPRLRLPLPAGPARQPEQGGGGGLPGAAAASGRGAAGEDEWAAHG
uniref:MIF4G domain containing n=3 Tax=Bos TaxID=9903 RepID=A0AAA9TW17_BOVIN